MDRRRFLKAGISLGGAGLLGLGGAGWAIQPRRHRLAPRFADDASRPLHPKGRRTVVVVGGGVAGLTAATSLAERGFAVTLVERAPALGGKLGGWTVSALGEQFPVEHGFHGFFAQYYNLRELLGAAGVGADLADSPGYPVLFGDRPEELFGNTTRIFPLNLISVVEQSRSLHFADFAHGGDGMLALLRYDPERTFAALDHTDFARFCREGGINRPMVETVLEPFGKTTLNRVDRLSAAEAVRFFHFYFMGNPEGLRFRFTRHDSMTAVIGPLRHRFEALSGKVRTGTAARELQRNKKGVSKVVVDGGAGPEPRLAVRSATVPDRGTLAIARGDGSSVFVTRRGGGFFALDGHCTHMGCPVAPDPATGGFRCPCHAGTFDAEGVPTGGPPRRRLARLEVHADGDELTIGGGAGAPTETLDCDYCVVACEVRGLQQLLAASSYLGESELARHVKSLGEADPYVVMRLWLDRAPRPDRSPFYTVARYRYTDSLALYSHFQEPYISWARRTGGSVVELHAYAIAPAALAPRTVIRDTMFAELQHMLPELAGARVLHEEYMQQDNFSRFAPGDHALRPPTETALPNLFLAGDHVRLPMPAALMEAAAISGRMAANGVLRAEGLREIPISTVAPRGPLA